MLAANNFPNIFDYLYPVVAKTLNLQQLELLINKQNATGNTPLRMYFIIQIMLLLPTARKWLLNCWMLKLIPI